MPPSSLHNSSDLLSYSTDNQKYPTYSLASRKTLLSSLQALHTTVTSTPVSSTIAIGLSVVLPGTLTGILVTKMLKHYFQQRTSVLTSIDNEANSDHFSSDPCTPVLSTPASPLFEDTDSSTEYHKFERQDSHHELIRLVPAAAFDYDNHSDNNDSLQLEIEYLQEALCQQQLQHQFERSVLEEKLRVCQAQNKQHQSQQDEDAAQLHALRFNNDNISDELSAIGEELKLSSGIQESLNSAIDATEQYCKVADDELLVQRRIIEELEDELRIAQDDLQCARADLTATTTPDTAQSAFELAWLESRAELLACQEKHEDMQEALEVELKVSHAKNEHMQRAMTKVFDDLKSRKGDRQQIADLEKRNREHQERNHVLQESYDYVDEQLRIRVLQHFELSDSLRNLKQENDRLEGLIKYRENECAQIDKRKTDYIAVMEEERVKTSKEVRDLKKVDSARLGELQTLRALKISLQKQLGEPTKTQPQAREAEAERDASVRELQRKVDDATHKWQESSKKCSAVEKELDKARTKLMVSQQKVEELTGSLSRTDIERQSLVTQVSELTINLSQVNLARQSLTTQLKELTGSLSQADVERQSLSSQVKDLTTNLSQAVLERQSLKTQLKDLTRNLSQAVLERRTLTTQLNEAQEDLHNARSARSDIFRQKELAEEAFSVKEAAYQTELLNRDHALFFANEDFATKEVAHLKDIVQRDQALLEAQQKLTEETNRCMTLETQLRTSRQANKRKGISERTHNEALQRAKDVANAAAQQEIAQYRARTQRADHNSSIWASALAQGIGIPKHIFDNMSDDSLNEVCVRVKMQDEENFRLLERIRALESGMHLSGPVSAAYGGFRWNIGPPPPSDYRLGEAMAAGSMMQRTSSRGSAMSADSTFAEVLGAVGDVQEAVRETLSRQVSARSGHTVIVNAGELEQAVSDDEGLYAEDDVPIWRPGSQRRASWS